MRGRLKSNHRRNNDSDRLQPACDLYALLTQKEFENLREFAAEFGDSLVLDKPMPRFPHLKRLVELGFIGRDGEEFYVTRFGKMRVNHGH